MGKSKSSNEQSKSIRRYNIGLPQFEWGFILFIGQDIDEVIEHVYNKFGFEAWGSLGFTAINDMSGIVVCGLSTESDDSTITHEALHLAHKMMNDKGIGTEQEEVMAYTQMYIIKLIKEKIWRIQHSRNTAKK